jgi:hypothetical protein
MTLDEAIQAVVAAHMQYQAVHQQVQHLREAWATSYAPLLQEEAVQKQAVRQAEEALRRLGIELYQSTGNKDIAPGVRVREMTRLTYDPQDALIWAIEPTFKGVWSTVVNFALWPPPDTKPGQYPQHHKRSDDSLGRHALGGWAYCPQRSVRVSLA